MKKYKTKQESLWAGRFGTEYTARNREDLMVASNTAFFAKVFGSLYSPIHSLVEFGAGGGDNLRAIKKLLPKLRMTAVEINSAAVKQLRDIKNVDVVHESIIGLTLKKTFDFVLIKGVLIHIDPNELANVYTMLYDASNKYICIAEYYNPTPVEVIYRRHAGVLFKRDFAGEMLDAHRDLHLVSYGFTYHRDENFYYDDTTWFLLAKK